MNREEFETEAFGLKVVAHGYLYPSEWGMKGFFELEELTYNGEVIDLDFFTNYQIAQIEDKVWEDLEEEANEC